MTIPSLLMSMETVCLSNFKKLFIQIALKLTIAVVKIRDSIFTILNTNFFGEVFWGTASGIKIE